MYKAGIGATDDSGRIPLFGLMSLRVMAVNMLAAMHLLTAALSLRHVQGSKSDLGVQTHSTHLC